MHGSKFVTLPELVPTCRQFDANVTDIDIIGVADEGPIIACNGLPGKQVASCMQALWRPSAHQSRIADEIIQGGVMKKLLLFPAVVLSLLLSSGAAHAQIIGQIDADIPFPFHAGLAKFPAGNYILRMEEGSNLSVLEIQSADGKHSALVEVREAQSKSEPQTGELIFNHVGERYFLARVFDDNNKLGSAVLDSGYSKKYGAGLEVGEQTHVPIHHHAESKKS
jgi:hypothetical protein